MVPQGKLKRPNLQGGTGKYCPAKPRGVRAVENSPSSAISALRMDGEQGSNCSARNAMPTGPFPEESIGATQTRQSPSLRHPTRKTKADSLDSLRFLRK